LHVTTELEGGAIEPTALGWAEYCGQPQIADLLRQRGATT